MEPAKLWSTQHAKKSVELVKQYLDRFHTQTGTRRPAIVFDVDETLLLNDSDDSTGRFAANKPIVGLYNYAVHELGMDGKTPYCNSLKK